MGGDCIQIPRFFVRPQNISEGNITIVGDDVNHIKKVLRLVSKDTIMVCDGMGKDYLAQIQSLERDFIVAGISESMESAGEPPVDITLYQGIPKSDKMDFIIQKSVELGVKRIVPVMTERTVVKLGNDKDCVNKVSRWQRISLEAAKQCSRGAVPEVHKPVNFQQALKDAEAYDLKLIPYEKDGRNGLKDCIQRKGIKNIALFIGPEGGFAESEIAKAQAGGVNPVTLGPRILRTETAGIAVISILMYVLGDVD